MELDAVWRESCLRERDFFGRGGRPVELSALMRAKIVAAALPEMDW